MICPDCGQSFNVAETKSDFNLFLFGKYYEYYDDLPYKMCYRCADRYLESMYISADDDDLNNDSLGEYYIE